MRIVHAAAAFAIGPEAARQARAVLRLHMAEPQNLESLIDELQQAPHARAVTLGDILYATGHRCFGPALLVPGLLLVTPAGGIPGMATLVGMIALLVAGQLVAGRKSFWLPQWMLRRHLDSKRFVKGLDKARRPARFVDRFVHARLQNLVRKPALQVLALACAAVGFVMPVLEVVPFALFAAAFCALSFALVGVAPL